MRAHGHCAIPCRLCEAASTELTIGTMYTVSHFRSCMTKIQTATVELTVSRPCRWMSQPTGRINIQTLLLLRKALCHRPLKLLMYQHSPSSLKYHPPSDQTLHNLQQSKARMPQANQPANATMTAMREEMPLVPSQVDVESTGQVCFKHFRDVRMRFYITSVRNSVAF